MLKLLDKFLNHTVPVLQNELHTEQQIELSDQQILNIVQLNQIQQNLSSSDYFKDHFTDFNRTFNARLKVLGEHINQQEKNPTELIDSDIQNLGDDYYIRIITKTDGLKEFCIFNDLYPVLKYSKNNLEQFNINYYSYNSSKSIEFVSSVFNIVRISGNYLNTQNSQHPNNQVNIQKSELLLNDYRYYDKEESKALRERFKYGNLNKFPFNANSSHFEPYKNKDEANQSKDIAFNVINDIVDLIKNIRV